MSYFIAHLHPLIVHLPIGILLFGFVLMCVQYFTKNDIEYTISWAFLLGAVSAVGACVAGWLLAQSGEYEADLVFKHQWTGIATAILGFLTYYFKRFRWILATVTVSVLTVAGHWGGTLTHGENYLFETEPTIIIPTNSPIDHTQRPAKVSNESKIHKTFVYQNNVVPILKNKCYSCHSATKKKGSLRLDAESFIHKGGKDGRILWANSPAKSHLYSYLTLAIDDEHHMPPKGKPQLTPQEILTIYNWIKKGASFVEETQIVTNNIPTAEVVLAIEKPQNTVNETIPTPLPIEPIDNAIIEKFKQQKIIISEEPNGIVANFVNVSNFESSSIISLQVIDKELVHVKLSNQPVSDNDIKNLVLLKKIVKINLDKTAITNQALVYLKTLPKLEQLNLYGTHITDEGLETLAQFTQLKIVYLWQTNVTSVGIEKLKTAQPRLIIETGETSLK
jgi:uncharacterized membrane protein